MNKNECVDLLQFRKELSITNLSEIFFFHVGDKICVPDDTPRCYALIYSHVSIKRN